MSFKILDNLDWGGRWEAFLDIPLQWRHNRLDSVSNNQPPGC